MDSGLRVYDEIYDIVKGNLESAGEEEPFTKDAFMYSVTQELNKIDLFDLISYDDDTFLQCLYIGLFYRTAEESARRLWAERCDKSDTEFQKQALESLTNSVEFSTKNDTVLYDNIYADIIQNPSFKITESSDNPYIGKLYRIYSKLPLFIRNMIKAVLGRA